jgi:hypothetical protein
MFNSSYILLLYGNSTNKKNPTYCQKTLTPYKIGYSIIIKTKKGNTLMTRTFIEIPLFTKRWKEIGLTDDELLALQIMLLENPKAGPIMEGTGGIRKVRFPIDNRGKSKSVRVCYTDFSEYEVIYLITAFEKKEQENLTNEEKNILKKLVKALKDEVAKNRG